MTRGWGGILNVVTSHFKNSIKAIIHVSTKLKQFHRKALNSEHCTLSNLTNKNVMILNALLTQFDVAPTRTRAGISLICDYLINEFDLMLILLKNNLSGNKNNFGTAVLI